MIPFFICRRLLLGRPVIVGEIHFLISRIEHVFQNVVLRDSKMLNEIPDRMIGSFGACDANRLTNSFERFFNLQMSLSSLQQFNNIFSERGFVHATLPSKKYSASNFDDRINSRLLDSDNQHVVASEASNP